MRSVEFALAMGKEIYVLPQRVGESGATNKLLAEGKAKAIYDIDYFVSKFKKDDDLSLHVESVDDDFIIFCKSNPSYDETLARFPARVFEAELAGDINIINGRVVLN